VSDAAPSRPSVGSGVAQCPHLDELVTGIDLGTIEDSVPDEVSIKTVIRGVADRGFDRDRAVILHDHLLMHGFDRLHKQIADGNLLHLGWGI
jgi:hypothetical protein